MVFGSTPPRVFESYRGRLRRDRYQMGPKMLAGDSLLSAAIFVNCF